MLYTLGLATVAGLVAKTNAAAVYAGMQTFGDNDEITVNVVVASDTVTLRMMGPTDTWYGAGFGQNATMTGYAVVVDKENDQSDSRMFEQALAGIALVGDTVDPQTLVSPQIQEVNDMRTAMTTRPRESDDDDVYDFPFEAGAIPMIYAFGSSVTLSLHADEDQGKDTLITRDTRYSGSVDLSDKSSVQVWLSGDESAEVTIKLCAENDGNWTAVGFCPGDTACSMEGTYALIMEGDGTRQERILGDHVGGDTIVTSDSGQTSGVESGASCMQIVRECEPDDIDEAAELPCGIDLAFAEEGKFNVKLIASLGGTAEFDGTAHTSKYSDLTLEMCPYIDGAEDPSCMDASVGAPTSAPTIATSMPSSATAMPSPAPTSATSSPTKAPSPTPVTSISGSVDLSDKSSVRVVLSLSASQQVRIQLCSSEVGKWAAVGFCPTSEACSMDGTYAVIMQGDESRAERILGNGEPGETISTGEQYSSVVDNGVQCMEIIRECEPEDITEAAAYFECLTADTVNDELNVTLIASLGGEAVFASTKHTSAYKDIVLTMCPFVGGEDDPECAKATITAEDGGGDGSSASTVSALMAFVCMVITIAFHF